MKPRRLPFPITRAALQINFKHEPSADFSARAHRQAPYPNLRSFREADANKTERTHLTAAEHQFFNNHSLTNGGHPYGNNSFAPLVI